MTGTLFGDDNDSTAAPARPLTIELDDPAKLQRVACYGSVTGITIADLFSIMDAEFADEMGDLLAACDGTKLVMIGEGDDAKRIVAIKIVDGRLVLIPK